MCSPASPSHAWCLLAETTPTPLDVVRRVWANELYREEVVYEVSRDVSKVGAFLSSTLSRDFGTALDVADLVWLYERIRDGSRRCEGEWRDEFMACCPKAASALPRSQDNWEEGDWNDLVSKTSSAEWIDPDA
jgi:hypothetical protein